MAEPADPGPLPDLDVSIDPDFEPQKRPRSCTWPLPRPESNAAKPGNHDNHDADIIPEEDDDEEDHSTSMAINVNGSITPPDDPHSYSPNDGLLSSSLGQDNSGSPLSSHSPSASSGTPNGAGQATTPRKSSSRRNAWGNMSYADLITKAIESTPDKRLTLSQIYDWMVRCVPYFKDKGDSNSSAGWKNSIRHNLSLHSRFIRVQNEGTGKSSWWMINPEGGKGGKAPRRRAVSMDNSNKYTKSARGRAAKKKAALQAAAAGGSEGGDSGSPSSSGLSRWPGSPASRSSEDLDAAWTDFRSRTNSNASTLSGRLSPILAGAHEPDDTPDDEDVIPPLSPMLYGGVTVGGAMSPGGNGAASVAAAPKGAELSDLNDGLTDDLMDELMDNITLALAPLAPPPPPGASAHRSSSSSSSFGFSTKPSPSPSSSSSSSTPSNPTPTPSASSPSAGSNGGVFASSLFGPAHSGLRPAPMQTIQENRQSSFSSSFSSSSSSFSSISRFGAQTLQELLGCGGPSDGSNHSPSDVMMTQSDPLMSQASAAAIISQNSRRGLMLRSDPVMTFGVGGRAGGGQGGLLNPGNNNHHQHQQQQQQQQNSHSQPQGALRVLNAGLTLGFLGDGKQQLLHSPLGGGTNGSSSMMQIDSALFLNGTTTTGGVTNGCPATDRFPSDLDLDMFGVGGLECDMDSIIRSELMDSDGLEISFDSLIGGLNGVVGGGFGGVAKQGSWVNG